MGDRPSPTSREPRDANRPAAREEPSPASEEKNGNPASDDSSDSEATDDKTLWQRIVSKMEPRVFFGAAILVVSLVVFAGGFTETARPVFESIKRSITDRFDTLYVMSASGVLLVLFALIFSPWAKIRLGKDEDRPEFKTWSWLAMLFGAGMGIGLVFFGVAEPVSHWANPPLGEARGAGTERALSWSFYHWGLHPWAIYVVLAAGIALFHFRYELPLAPRSLLWPLIGKRIYGWIGHVVDIVCTVGTLIGVATSLGLGALQLNAGISRAGFFEISRSVQIGIVAVITLIATISVVTGVHRGIQRLSQFNLILAALLCLFVLFTGPTLEILEGYVGGLAEYVNRLPFMSTWVAPEDTGQREWQRTWTLSYWGWWFAWAPFVGVFVARISRGRTLREFLIAVLAVPSLASAFWMSVFGGAGLSLARNQLSSTEADSFVKEVTETPELALQALLEFLPFSSVTTVVAIVLTFVFFITSSDSGSLVDDMVTSGGHRNPPRAQRIFWAVSEGAMAAALLLTNGVQALRTAAASVGVPVLVLVLLTVLSLLVAMYREFRKPRGVSSKP